MIDKLRQIIKEEVVKLPKESQEVINTFGWEKIIEEVGKKYLLNENEINGLQVEVALILLGIVEEDLLSINIENRIGTSKNEAEKITSEINQKVFEPMLEKRDSLIKTIPPTKPINLPVLDSKFSNLPKNVQDAITKSGWKQTLYSLAPKYKLNIEQMGILEEITTKVILGEVRPEAFGNELSSKVNISKEDTTNMIKEIDENIFKRIRGFEENIKEENSSREKIIKNEEKKIIKNINSGKVDVGQEEGIPLPPYKTINNENAKEEPIINKKQIDTDYQLPIKNEKIEEKKEIPRAENEEHNIDEILKNIDIKKSFENKIPINTNSNQVSGNPKNIIEEKLKVNTVSEDVVSDYSTPKKNDPYREAV